MPSACAFSIEARTSANRLSTADATLRAIDGCDLVYDCIGLPGDQVVADAHRVGDQPGVDLDATDWESHQAICRGHQPFHDFVYRRIGQDGRARWLSVSGEPVFDAKGAFLGYQGVGRDVTDEKRSAQELQRSKDLYAALSQTNRAIIHIREPQALFAEVDELIGVGIDVVDQLRDSLVPIARRQRSVGDCERAQCDVGEPLEDVDAHGARAGKAIAQRLGVDALVGRGCRVDRLRDRAAPAGEVGLPVRYDLHPRHLDAPGGHQPRNRAPAGAHRRA